MTNNIPKSNNIYINKFNKLLKFYFTDVALGDKSPLIVSNIGGTD